MDSATLRAYSLPSLLVLNTEYPISTICPLEFLIIYGPFIQLKYNKKRENPEGFPLIFTTFLQRLVKADTLTKLDVE